MAQYVDVTNLPNFEVTCSNGEKYILLPYEHLSDIPTADVAQRAEVDKAKLNGYELGKREVARGIMNEAKQALLNMVLANAMGETYDIQKRFYEIEKKYTDATDIGDGHKTEQITEFAKFLIDESIGGKIYVCDIPDLVAKYREGQK